MNPHYAVHKAITSGALKRKPCEKCGSLNVEAHHPNYAFPLRVRWLCSYHHKALHVHLRKIGRSLELGEHQRTIGIAIRPKEKADFDQLCKALGNVNRVEVLRIAIKRLTESEIGRSNHVNSSN